MFCNGDLPYNGCVPLVGTLSSLLHLLHLTRSGLKQCLKMLISNGLQYSCNLFLLIPVYTVALHISAARIVKLNHEDDFGIHMR